MVVDTSAKSDLLSDLSANRNVELELGKIHLDSSDSRARTQRSDVQHENLTALELLNTRGLLVALSAHTEQTAQQERADLDVRVDVGQRVDGAERVTHHTIGTAQLRVDLGSDTDETAWHGVLQVVLLRVQAQDLGLDWTAVEFAGSVSAYYTWSNFDLLANL